MNTNLDQGKLEILDKSLKKGFAQVPRAVLKADRLSRNAKCLYALLLDYAWQKDSCFPGQGKLAKDLCVSERTIRRDLIELKEHRLIDWNQRGKNKTNLYYILPLDILDKSDRTEMTSWDRTNLTVQDRTNMSDIIEEENNTQSKYTQLLSLQKQNEDLKDSSKTKLFLTLNKSKIDFESFDPEAKLLATELNDKENIFYYQSLVRRRNKGEITDSQIQTALWAVKNKIREDQVDGSNYWKKPGALFANRIKDILQNKVLQTNIAILAKSKSMTEPNNYDDS